MIEIKEIDSQTVKKKGNLKKEAWKEMIGNKNDYSDKKKFKKNEVMGKRKKKTEG